MIDPKTHKKYFEWLSEWAAEHSDGCTGVPDFRQACCWQHDYCYQLGLDPRATFYEQQARPISRREADALFRDCCQAQSPFHRFSPLSWWRWAGVRLAGRWFYPKNKA